MIYVCERRGHGCYVRHQATGRFVLSLSSKIHITRMPQKGLNLLKMPVTPHPHLKRNRTRKHLPQHSEQTFVLCQLWPRPVSKSLSLWCRKAANILTCLPEAIVTVTPSFSEKNVQADHIKVGNCTLNSYARRAKRSLVALMKIMFSLLIWK